MQNNKIIIEHYINDTDINGNPRDLLIIRGLFKNKQSVKDLVKPYIEENKDNLNFNGKKPKMKNLRYNGKSSVEEDRTNQCLWIKDPELIKYILANYNKDLFEVTADPQIINTNRDKHTSRQIAAKEEADRRWTDAASKWENRIGWRR